MIKIDDSSMPLWNVSDFGVNRARLVVNTAYEICGQIKTHSKNRVCTITRFSMDQQLAWQQQTSYKKTRGSSSTVLWDYRIPTKLSCYIFSSNVLHFLATAGNPIKRF